MSTSRGIHNIVSPYAMGDVEKYFVKLDRMIGTNSGKKNYGMMTHSSYSTSCPFGEMIPTKFRLTDNQYDIIDISQGLLQFKIKFDLEFKVQHRGFDQVSTSAFYECWWFVGLKSGAHIIDNYSVYSNGRLTSCKQVKAVDEQSIVFNCKSNEQINARPGLYTAHEDVLKMNNCVCGFYIAQPNTLMSGGSCMIEGNEMEIIVQVDDLLPFSGMKYFPAFACGDLEIELALTLNRNFVFCPIPIEAVYAQQFKHHTMFGEGAFRDASNNVTITQQYSEYDDDQEEEKRVIKEQEYTNQTLIAWEDLSYLSSTRVSEIQTESKKRCDFRFHQCGEYCKTRAAIVNKHYGNDLLLKNHFRSAPVDEADHTESKKDFNVTSLPMLVKKWVDKMEYKDTEVTIIPCNLTVIDAKSYVYGFDIRDQSKQNLLAVFKQQKKLIIPAQWINHQIFNQRPGSDSIKNHMTLPMYEVSELIFTFPQNEYQRTVSRNPYLRNLRCTLDDKMVPDKDVSTTEAAHAEMTLSALGFDSFFSPNPPLAKSLKPENVDTCRLWVPRREDDSNYMFVVDLERNGSGVHHDGYTNPNALINLDAMFIGGIQNPHYYERHLVYNTNFNAAVQYNGPTTEYTDALIFSEEGTYPTENTQVVVRETNHHTPVNLYTVCDAYWLFTPSGGEFMKEGAAVTLVREKELNLAVNHMQ